MTLLAARPRAFIAAAAAVLLLGALPALDQPAKADPLLAQFQGQGGGQGGPPGRRFGPPGQGQGPGPQGRPGFAGQGSPAVDTDSGGTSGVDAAAQPPAGAGPGQLAEFYLRRAQSASALGRAAQWRADSEEALRQARSAGVDLGRFLNSASRAEFTTGDWNGAMNLVQEAVRDARPNQFKIVVSMSTLGARLEAKRGNMPEAAAWLKRADDTWMTWQARLSQRRPNAPVLEFWREQVLYARALVEGTRGNAAAGEQIYRELLDSIDKRLAPDSADAENPELNPVSVANFRHAVEFDFAGHLAQAGKMVEAEAEARRALLDEKRRHGETSALVGNDLRVLAGILAGEGRYAEGETMARQALTILQQAGVDPKSIQVTIARSTIATMDIGQEKWAEALQAFDALKADIASDPSLMRKFFGSNKFYATVLLQTGHAQDAIPVLERAVRGSTASFGENHPNTGEVRALYARALAATGQRDRALNEYRAAMPALMTSSRQADVEEEGAVAADRRVRRIIESYMGLLAANGDGASIEESFRVADAARGGSVQRAVVASSARAAANDPALGDLVRREQDASRQVAALERLLADVLAAPAEQQDPANVKAVRAQIQQQQSARADVRAQISRKFPDYAKLIDPQPLTVDQVRKTLHPNEVMVSTYVGRDKTYVWAVPASGQARFVAAGIGEADVGAMVKTLRKSLDPEASTLSDIPDYDVGTAYKLYAALLKPVEDVWAQADTLLIVQHGALGQLPFDVLVTEPYAVPAVAAGAPPFSNYRDVPWLARKVAVAQLPSVGALAALRAVPPPPSNRLAFAGFGDPWFNSSEAEQARKQVAANAGTIVSRGLSLTRRNAPNTHGNLDFIMTQLPRLPDTAEEVRAIGTVLGADPARDIFLGDRASKHRVKTLDLFSRRVVLFATHGLMAGEVSELTEPALALTPASVSGDGEDGLLTLSDIMALRLNADWVVLSACNTAAGDGAGAEAVSGLGRGFFYAGARALLVTHWPVETTSAETVTVDLFRRQAADPKLSRAAALRAAKLALIASPGYIDTRSNAVGFAYAHPMFWAPYALIGEPG
jgi:CHAT domain-containing protein